MLVLVTGATGFLGAHIVRTLLAQNDKVRALVRPGSARNHIRKLGVEFIEGNLLDEKVMEKACEGVDAIIHCAALLSYWSRQNAMQYSTNVDGVSILLRAAHKARVRRIVHVSSVAAVGATRNGEVLDESAVWNLHGAGVHYAHTKHQGEQRMLAAAWGGMPIVVVNPSSMFGPRLDGRPPSPLITGIMRGRLPWIPPGGVSITDVSDVAAACVRAQRAGTPGSRYILAGHNVTWEQLYNSIADAADGRLPKLKLTARRLRMLKILATCRDKLRLSRPPWTPELYRSYGSYSWYRSAKAERELSYSVRSLRLIIRHAIGRELP
ncbi:MAG: dihydroflavonol-4-reductase [Planctomycetota bacterium]|jgi:dihydroflavonol-4-reductase